MITIRGLLSFVFCVSLTMLACGDDDGEGQSTEKCIAGCGEGCPAPEFRICASDGEWYCNEGIIECYGLTVADDESTCGENHGGTADSDT